MDSSSEKLSIPSYHYLIMKCWFCLFFECVIKDFWFFSCDFVEFFPLLTSSLLGDAFFCPFSTSGQASSVLINTFAFFADSWSLEQVLQDYSEHLVLTLKVIFWSLLLLSATEAPSASYFLGLTCCFTVCIQNPS